MWRTTRFQGCLKANRRREHFRGTLSKSQGPTDRQDLRSAGPRGRRSRGLARITGEVAGASGARLGRVGFGGGEGDGPLVAPIAAARSGTGCPRPRPERRTAGRCRNCESQRSGSERLIVLGSERSRGRCRGPTRSGCLGYDMQIEGRGGPAPCRCQSREKKEHAQHTDKDVMVGVSVNT